MSEAALRLVEKDGMDKEKALESALSQIERAFGKGSIMKLGQQGAAIDIEAVSTGSIGLDIALGIGGLPKGRIIEIYGPESSVKTTLALHVIAEAQKNGGICAFVDAEHALDPGYARKLGVDTLVAVAAETAVARCGEPTIATRDQLPCSREELWQPVVEEVSVAGTTRNIVEDHQGRRIVGRQGVEGCIDIVATDAQAGGCGKQRMYEALQAVTAIEPPSDAGEADLEYVREIRMAKVVGGHRPAARPPRVARVVVARGCVLLLPTPRGVPHGGRLSEAAPFAKAKVSARWSLIDCDDPTLPAGASAGGDVTTHAGYIVELWRGFAIGIEPTTSRPCPRRPLVSCGIALLANKSEHGVQVSTTVARQCRSAIAKLVDFAQTTAEGSALLTHPPAVRG